MFSLVLEQLQPVCVSEQKFLVSFFHFDKDHRLMDADDLDHYGEVDEDGKEETDGRPSLSSYRASPDPSQEGVENVLVQLFTVLLSEIEGLIQFGERKDG